MTAPVLKESQLEMARFLRNPDTSPAPADVEPRRLKIYQDLIYNNIESFISGGFPVLRSLYTEENWHELVRQFIDGHRCHTPYFLEISQEFLNFLMQGYERRECDPAFIAELAHYEWVELALDVSEENIDSGEVVANADPLEGVPVLSPLAWLLSYQYPVQKIGPGFQPEEAGEATYLAVYRDRSDTVKFMELNGATARLLEMIRDNTEQTGHEVLDQLATELNMSPDSVRGFGGDLLRQFADSSIISGCRSL